MRELNDCFDIHFLPLAPSSIGTLMSKQGSSGNFGNRWAYGGPGFGPAAQFARSEISVFEFSVPSRIAVTRHYAFS
jgi:hypothetical protein